MSKDSEKGYHTQGEKNASADKYHPPLGAADPFTWSKSGMEEANKELKAYNEGYYNVKGQKDGNKGEYKPPRDSDSKDAYDSGHSSSSDKGSGGCFITTATLVSIGKPDNCDELNTFRNFRDNWLANQSDGQKLISEYYSIAPRIVEAINSQNDSNKIYNNIWNESLVHCFNFIKNKSNKEAKVVYCDIVAKLKQRFLDNKTESMC